MSQIVSFGRLLKFSIELERRAAEFYEKCARRSPRSDVLLKLAQGNRRRAAMLDRVRRESVTEMILERIEGLSSDQVTVPDSDREDWPALALGLEESLGNFYTEAAEKARLVLADARHAFERLGKEHAKRTADLKMTRGRR